jgi:hypothetical protein
MAQRTHRLTTRLPRRAQRTGAGGRVMTAPPRPGIVPTTEVEAAKDGRATRGAVRGGKRAGPHAPECASAGHAEGASPEHGRGDATPPRIVSRAAGRHG